MASNRRPIAGNTRNGRLYATGREGRYEGERRVAGGKFETRTFRGGRSEAIAEWESWRAETAEQASIIIDKGDDKMAASIKTNKQNTAKQAAEDMVYVVAYAGPGVIRPTGAFLSKPEAERACAMLGKALEAMAADGYCDVWELPIWD